MTDDLDAMHQRVADLEALLASPGWDIVLQEASKHYSQRAFAEEMAKLARGATAAQIGERAIGLIAAYNAVVGLLTAPGEELKALKSKISARTAGEQKRTRGLGPNVEMS